MLTFTAWARQLAADYHAITLLLAEHHRTQPAAPTPPITRTPAGGEMLDWRDIAHPDEWGHTG